MWIRNVALLIVLSVIAPATGCLERKRDDYLSSRDVSVADPSERADALWVAIKDTLRRHGFQLDRINRRGGVITTMPLTSKQFFEFWRRDVKTQEDLWEATLNPIRRRVEVAVARGPGEAWKTLYVTVHKERLSSPDRQFNNTGAAYQFFGDNLPSTTGLVRVTPEDNQWLDQGRDYAMEDHLLRAILRDGGLDAGVEATEGISSAQQRWQRNAGLRRSGDARANPHQWAGPAGRRCSRRM